MSVPIARRRTRIDAGPGPTPRGGLRRRQRWFSLALLSPGIIGAAVFFGYPLVTILLLSFSRYNLIKPPEFIGLANYEFLFSDPMVPHAIVNTLWFAVVVVILQLVYALGVAMLVTRIKRGSTLARAVFYLPSMIPPIASALAFIYLLNPGTGPVAAALRMIGVDSPLWFDDPHWSKPALTLLALWGTGNLMVIFFAALLDVPTELTEASTVDGANAIQRFRHVTLPSIAPVLQFAAVTAVIDALQYFAQAYMVSNVHNGGGAATTLVLGYPQNSTLFYPVYLYVQGFRYFNMGYAAALAMVLFVVSMIVAALMMRGSRRLVHAEAEES